MGNKHLDSSIFPYQNHKWHPSSCLSILISVPDGIEAQYQIVESLSESEMRCLGLRVLEGSVLVGVLAVFGGKEWEKVSGSGGNGRGDGYVVLVERIGYRLPDLGALGYCDGLYILRQGIKAIRSLSNLFPNFQLQEQAIGINEDGQCKFWVNANYFRNQVAIFIEDEKDYQDNGTEIGNQRLYQESLRLREVYGYGGEKKITGNKTQKTKGNNKQCCLTLKNICNPEQHPSPTTLNHMQLTLNSSSKCSKKLRKTLYNFITLIENKMFCVMSKEESIVYRGMKEKYFGSSKNNKKMVNNGCNVQQSENYTIQNAEKWISELCRYAGVDPEYRICLPGKNDSFSSNSYLKYGVNNNNKNNSSNIYASTHDQNSINGNTKSRLARNNSNSDLPQFDAIRSNKNQHNGPSAKLNNFKIVAQPKTSLKKQSSASKDQPPMKTHALTHTSIKNVNNNNNADEDLLAMISSYHSGTGGTGTTGTGGKLDRIRKQHKKESTVSQLSIKSIKSNIQNSQESRVSIANGQGHGNGHGMTIGVFNGGKRDISGFMGSKQKEQEKPKQHSRTPNPNPNNTSKKNITFKYKTQSGNNWNTGNNKYQQFGVREIRQSMSSMPGYVL